MQSCLRGTRTVAGCRDYSRIRGWFGYNTAMPASDAPRNPSTHIWELNEPWPDQVRALIARDTRGCQLEGKARINRFPASSHCVITWFLHGEVDLLSAGGVAQRTRLAACVVSGCQAHPTTSENIGDVHGFMAMFYPDAFHALFGVDLAALQNTFVDARQVLPPHGLELVDAVSRACGDTERQAVIEQFLAQYAQPMPATVWTRLRRITTGISLRLASAMSGVGPRQLQRLALRETGLNLQTLIRLWRGERSFLRAQRRFRLGQPLVLADHAIDVGYADQSHLVRECKAQTGRTPTQLAREVQTEEADWIYRLDIPFHENSPPTRSP
jgi:AraC-like DNA-binding protein